MVLCLDLQSIDDEGVDSNRARYEGIIARRHLGVVTWVWPGPLRVSEVMGRNTCYEEGGGGGGISLRTLLFDS